MLQESKYPDLSQVLSQIMFSHFFLLISYFWKLWQLPPPQKKKNKNKNKTNQKKHLGKNSTFWGQKITKFSKKNMQKSEKTFPRHFSTWCYVTQCKICYISWTIAFYLPNTPQNKTWVASIIFLSMYYQKWVRNWSETSPDYHKRGRNGSEIGPDYQKWIPIIRNGFKSLEMDPNYQKWIQI